MVVPLGRNREPLRLGVAGLTLLVGSLHASADSWCLMAARLLSLQVMSPPAGTRGTVATGASCISACVRFECSLRASSIVIGRSLMAPTGRRRPDECQTEAAGIISFCMHGRETSCRGVSLVGKFATCSADSTLSTVSAGDGALDERALDGFDPGREERGRGVERPERGALTLPKTMPGCILMAGTMPGRSKHGPTSCTKL
mmetsp:Transcript_79749/g.141198  ORF Transcript_79749/g.141198 Transcript_79749/m.141198 type:complete len:201 (+) Transcript_79749:198-800(+)